MKLKIFSILSIWAFLTLSASTALAQKSIKVGEGESLPMQFPGLTKIYIGNPQVADVKVTGDQVILMGRRLGATNMIVWIGTQTEKYDVHVTPIMGPALATIRNILGLAEGIIIRSAGQYIILEGTALTAADYEKVQLVTNLFSQVKNLVKLNPLISYQLNRALANAGLHNVKTTVIGSTVFLEGSVGSKGEMRKAELITKSLGERVENLLVVGSQMVMLSVQFVEIRRSSSDNIGFAWPTAFTGTGNLAGTFFLIKPDANSKNSMQVNVSTPDISLTLNTLFSNGYARLLAQPKLVCASGENAEFLAGGEVPIPMITRDVTYVTFKKFGIILKIKPDVSGDSFVKMLIEAEVSQIDRSISVMNIPGFRTRQVKTNVTIKSGQTIVLSGLFSNDEQKDVQKFPLLGNIPILGELFKSRAFRDERSNLVVFVTPYMVKPESPIINEMITNIQQMYKKARAKVRWEILD